MECFILRVLGGPIVISYQHDLRQIPCFDFSGLYSHGLLYVCSQSVVLDKEKPLGFSQHLHPLSQS